MRTFLILTLGIIAVHAKPVDDTKPVIITKHNFLNFRQQKQVDNIKVPPPFVVSTELHVNGESRRGRTFKDTDGSTVVEGIRLPDDESDRVTWRNGRVINNVFVPDGAPVPEEAVVSARQGRQMGFDFPEYYRGRKQDLPDTIAMESRKQETVVPAPSKQYHAGTTDNGRPVYYVVEEPDSLHSDRSPYDFEPADTHTSLQSSAGLVADYTQAGVNTQAAGGGDFVIKEHTYTMCPGCPSFSIPIPIPKASYEASLLEQEQQDHQQQQQYQFARDKSFLEKIGDRIMSSVQGLQTKALGLFGGESNHVEQIDRLSEKVGEVEVEEKSGSMLPAALAAGAAVATLGGLAFFASNAGGTPVAVGRSNARALDDRAAEIRRGIDEVAEVDGEVEAVRSRRRRRNAGRR